MSDTTYNTIVDLKKEQHEIEENGVVYIEESTYRVFSDGSEVLACTSKYPKPFDEVITPEPTQLDRIEMAINKSHQDIIDEYTLELIMGGVI